MAKTAEEEPEMYYHDYIIYGAIALMMKFNQTFVDFPKIQKPNTFTADQAVEKMQSTVSGS